MDRYIIGRFDDRTERWAEIGIREGTTTRDALDRWIHAHGGAEGGTYGARLAPEKPWDVYTLDNIGNLYPR